MNDLNFVKLHEHLVEAVPELVPAITLLCQDEVLSANGVPSQYGGTSIILEIYLAILLAHRSSPLRDAALTRTFDFVEEMFASHDVDVVGLAEIQLIEGQPAWWFQRAMPFMGPLYCQAASRWAEAGWAAANAPGTPLYPPFLQFHDPYDVRQVIATLLAPEGVTLADLLNTEKTS